MPKAKKRVVKKSSKSSQARKPARLSNADIQKNKKIVLFRNILLAILLTVLIAILFIRFSGITGNAITGNAAVNYGTGQGDWESSISSWGKDPDWKYPLFDEIGFIFSVLLGQTGYDVVLTKIIFALISFMFVFYLVNKVTSDEMLDLKLNSGWKVVLSFLLGLLFTRWVLQDDLVKAVLMPYNIVGAVMATMIPIVVVFYIFFFMKPFNTAKYGPLRTIGLTLLIVFFGANGIFMTLGNTGSAEKPQYSWAYLVAAGIVFIILLAQKRILQEFKVALAFENIEGTNKELANDYRLKLINVEKLLLNTDTKDPQYKVLKEQRKDILNEIYNLSRYEIKK